jgi:hypothetical protein
MNTRIHKILFYGALFCVYGIFFSVESFYNFEGQPQTQKVFSYSVVKASPVHSTTAHGFRLNKRYHPEAISPCPLIAPGAPESFPAPVTLGSPADNPLAELAIVPYPLRGPPAAA